MVIVVWGRRHTRMTRFGSRGTRTSRGRALKSAAHCARRRDEGWSFDRQNGAGLWRAARPDSAIPRARAGSLQSAGGHVSHSLREAAGRKLVKRSPAQCRVSACGTHARPGDGAHPDRRASRCPGLVGRTSSGLSTGSCGEPGWSCGTRRLPCGVGSGRAEMCQRSPRPPRGPACVPTGRPPRKDTQHFGGRLRWCGTRRFSTQRHCSRWPWYVAHRKGDERPVEPDSHMHRPETSPFPGQT